MATSDALERRKDGLRCFASIFVRFPTPAREAGHGSSPLSLGQAISRADEELAAQIAAAPAPFWRHVRDALAERHP